MDATDVLQIYNHLASKRIPIWVDGGWCVDALLGRQTRQHPDLDIAVDRQQANRLREVLVSLGYSLQTRNDTTEWNYVMADDHGRAIDVHVFEFDEQGNNVYGIEYPRESLTGVGTILGQEVQCIAPKWMFTFKTSYAPKEKDLRDVHALSEKYGFKVPASHQ